MASHKSVYIDQFSKTSDGRTFWLKAWSGQIELWKAFWIYFIFGHGIVIGLGFGLIVIVMTMGLAFLPGSLDAGFLGLIISGLVLGLCYLVFATWVSVSVWRAANNCVHRCWLIGARFTMIVYASCFILPIFW